MAAYTKPRVTPSISTWGRLTRVKVRRSVPLRASRAWSAAEPRMTSARTTITAERTNAAAQDEDDHLPEGAEESHAGSTDPKRRSMMAPEGRTPAPSGREGAGQDRGPDYLGGAISRRLGDRVVVPLRRIGRGHLDDEVLGRRQVALRVEVDRAGDAREVLEGADGVGHRGAGRHLVAGGLGGVLDRLQADGHRVVALGSERLGIGAVLGLEVGLELGRAGVELGRAGDGGVVGAAARHDRLAADLDRLGRVEAVIAEEDALVALLTGLLEEDRNLVVDAAEEDHVRVGGQQRASGWRRSWPSLRCLRSPAPACPWLRPRA